MEIIPIERFVSGLSLIPEDRFGIGAVYEFLKNRQVEPDSLEPYIFFSKTHYTRNLVYKNHLFELIAICWDVGQCSQIHNHQNQRCWMSIPIGRLRVQNFRVVEQDDATGFCRLEPTDAFDIHRGLPAEVNLEEPVHLVHNVADFDQQAVSLHIYSRPFDKCLVYSTSKNKYWEIALQYTSEYGRLCEGAAL